MNRDVPLTEGAWDTLPRSAAGAGLRQPSGQIVDARPDVVLSHDNTAAIARLSASLGRARVHDPERLAITLDHAVPAPTAQHAQNHAEVRRFVAEQGIAHFFEGGPRHLPPGDSAKRRLVCPAN